MKKDEAANAEKSETPVKEVNEKEKKREKRREGAERRKKLKRADRIARWSGAILLGLVLLIGFVLWVAGEMQSGAESAPTQPRQQRVAEPSPYFQRGTVNFQ